MSDQTFYNALVDYHMHTPLCLHAEGEPVEYAKRAVELGLSEIGFSEHMPMPSHFDSLRMKESDFEPYLSKVELARKTYPKLPIRFAIEAEYAAGEEKYIENFFKGT